MAASDAPRRPRRHRRARSGGCWSGSARHSSPRGSSGAAPLMRWAVAAARAATAAAAAAAPAARRAARPASCTPSGGACTPCLAGTPLASFSTPSAASSATACLRRRLPSAVSAPCNARSSKASQTAAPLCPAGTGASGLLAAATFQVLGASGCCWVATMHRARTGNSAWHAHQVTNPPLPSPRSTTQQSPQNQAASRRMRWVWARPWSSWRCCWSTGGRGRGSLGGDQRAAAVEQTCGDLEAARGLAGGGRGGVGAS